MADGSAVTSVAPAGASVDSGTFVLSPELRRILEEQQRRFPMVAAPALAAQGAPAPVDDAQERQRVLAMSGEVLKEAAQGTHQIMMAADQAPVPEPRYIDLVRILEGQHKFLPLIQTVKETEMATQAAPLTGINASIVSAVATVETDVEKYTPLALQAVMQVEATLADAPSMTKLATGIGLVIDAAKIGQQIPIPSVQAISGLINLFAQIVDGLNKSGLFKHKTVAAVPTVTVAAVAAPQVTPDQAQQQAPAEAGVIGGHVSAGQRAEQILTLGIHKPVTTPAVVAPVLVPVAPSA